MTPASKIVLRHTLRADPVRNNGGWLIAELEAMMRTALVIFCVLGASHSHVVATHSPDRRTPQSQITPDPTTISSLPASQAFNTSVITSKLSKLVNCLIGE